MRGSVANDAGHNSPMPRIRFLPLLVVIAIFAAACGGSTSQTTTTTTFAPLASDSSTTVTTTTTTTVATTTTTTKPPDTDPPVIATVPADGDVVTTYVVKFDVSTEPGAAVLFDDEHVEVDAQGSFAVTRPSDLGPNTVTVEATDEAGNTSTTEVTYSFEPEEGWVVAIGDSVLLGSKIEVEKRLGDGVVDGKVSRQFRDGITMVEKLLARGVPPQVIIMALGTNGPATEGLFDEMMKVAAEVPLMVFVNVRVPRKWESTTNTTLAEGTERYDNAVLVDWWTPTHDRDDLFAKDGFHPKQPGRVIYAELVAEAIFPNWEPLGDGDE